MRKLLLVILFNAYFLNAQNTGQLIGRILDQQTQLPIQGVSVILEGTAMGVATNEEGYFTFRDIPTQTYNLTISHLGYQTQTVYNIIVKTFGTPPLQILLEETTNELEEIVVFQSPFRTTVETPLIPPFTSKSPLNVPARPTILPATLVAVKAPEEELNVKLVPVLGAKSPVAAVKKDGKQVVSELSSATVMVVEAGKLVKEAPEPENVVADTVPVTVTPVLVVSSFLESL